MIWEFWEHEKDHGKSAKAYDVVFNGYNRDYTFANDPKHQRICTCKQCKTVIPREVPRLKLNGAYYYGAGFYCLSCGIQILEEKKAEYQQQKKELEKQIGALDGLLDTSEAVMNNEWYPKKMALGKMIQVMKE